MKKLVRRRIGDKEDEEEKQRAKCAPMRNMSINVLLPACIYIHACVCAKNPRDATKLIGRIFRRTFYIPSRIAEPIPERRLEQRTWKPVSRSAWSGPRRLITDKRATREERRTISTLPRNSTLDLGIVNERLLNSLGSKFLGMFTTVVITHVRKNCHVRERTNQLAALSAQHSTQSNISDIRVHFVVQRV